ncbi:hypothetical protein VOLCADRAFT_97634 [Volvox carteri f. nagariensis]|uniref:F-box domain-containing protein n=1 Tax=Volvox carteri f. nagariensis TaxID=3068 RepID=D8UD84_VOLCA|nr:uncharacterized protein VOLCADRAFT_97634 [Volvox carteri f. nagariensis]EFJ42388.1 hypothetical protein VOLCADRAFT_97634 [Volvox carteri f. nagariensis]|eukprot:XP_002956621.1 hypothetical protein VOLCADRAFT_97634 [Volvox carteri f. nagariensis]
MNQNVVFELFDLPHDYLEALVLHHLPETSLGPVRATCRQLKVLADRRLPRLTIQFNTILRHSFWRTSPLPNVTTLILEMQGSTSAPGATGAPDTAAIPTAPLLQPAPIPAAQPFHQPFPQRLQHPVAATASVGTAPPPPPLPQPLPTLLPPVTFAGLRRHLPGLRHLTLRNVHFPESPGTAAAAGDAGGRSAATAAVADYPLDLSGLESLSLEGVWEARRKGTAPRSWRMQHANPFPSGLGPSLARASSSLTSLSLSHVTFGGSSSDVLRRLTGLVELNITSCVNAGSDFVTVLAQLTRLTHLAYVDVYNRNRVVHQLAALSSLTRLRSANFSRYDLGRAEVLAWAAWGPSLTRLVMSSKWQAALHAVPLLLPSLTSLEHLDLSHHCLDRHMWRIISGRMPRLAYARFSWVNLAAVDANSDGSSDDEEVESVEEDSGEEEGEGGGGGQGVDEGAAAVAGGELAPLETLRVLRLDGPWEGDECSINLLALLPQLEELRILDDPAALAAIAEDDPGVYDRLGCWTIAGSKLLKGGGQLDSDDAIDGGAESLRLLSIPLSWLQHVLVGAAFPNLRTLKVHAVQPGEGDSARALQRAHSPPALLAEAQLRTSWRALARPGGGGSAAAAAAVWAPNLTELEVPRDLDAVALAPLCHGVRHLRISQSYGDGLLTLMEVAVGPDRPLPRLQEVTLAGSLRSGIMEAEVYLRALLQVLAERGVRRVHVTLAVAITVAGERRARSRRFMKVAVSWRGVALRIAQWHLIWTVTGWSRIFSLEDSLTRWDGQNLYYCSSVPCAPVCAVLF